MLILGQSFLLSLDIFQLSRISRSFQNYSKFGFFFNFQSLFTVLVRGGRRSTSCGTSRFLSKQNFLATMKADFFGNFYLYLGTSPTMWEGRGSLVYPSCWTYGKVSSRYFETRICQALDRFIRAFFPCRISVEHDGLKKIVTIFYGRQSPIPKEYLKSCSILAAFN